LLLDDLRDRPFDGAGVRTLVVGGDDDLWRGDRWIRLDAEGADRVRAAERDQDRDDPGVDRTLDEEIGHVGVPGICCVAGAGVPTVA
jgi:hypothetical protein